MESNFVEQKMKLTKAGLVEEYKMAISTIESKDADLADSKNINAKLRDEIKRLNATIKDMAQNTAKLEAKLAEPKPEPKLEPKPVEPELNVKQQAQYEQLALAYTDLLKERNELFTQLSQLIDLTDVSFNLIANTVNSGFSVFDVIKTTLAKKYILTTPKVPEGGKQ